MPVIVYEVMIDAPIDICFNLARDIDAHQRSVQHTNERAVGGVTSGLIELGDTVTWEAVHFGVKQRLTAKITAMEKPYMFVDEMVSGAFKSFVHTHEFHNTEDGTLMRDTFDYKSPLGLIGTLADKLFLEKYMQRFIVTRADALKRMAESYCQK